jgi:hypothetical protein
MTSVCRAAATAMPRLACPARRLAVIIETMVTRGNRLERLRQSP